MPQPSAGGPVRLLAETDRLADLLPHLHAQLLEATTGRVSVVLEADGRPGGLVATSGAGLDDLPRSGWFTSPDGQTLVARLSASHTPIRLMDLKGAWPDLYDRLGTRHAVALPLGPHARGALLLAGLDDLAPLDAREAAIGTAVAMFALALERARLRREIALQRGLAAALEPLARVDETGEAAALGGVCRQVRQLFGASRADVWVYQRATGELLLTASDPAGSASERRLPPAETMLGKVLHARTARWEPSEPGTAGAATETVTVPLRGRRRALGVLVLADVSADPGGRADLVERADAAGRQLSAALENATLIDEVVRARRELEDIFDSIADLIVVCDADLQVTQANQAFAGRARKARGDLRGLPLAALVGPDLHALARDALVTPAVARTARELADAALDGTFAVVVSHLRGATRPAGLVIVARDVTDRVRLEAERADLAHRLAQADKLAAVGQFVAGIAHELNNPLQGVLGLTELLRRSTPPAQIDRELRSIHREADRAAKIVRNLLVFSGGRRLNRRRVAIGTIVARVATLRARALKEHGILFERELPSDLPFVYADPLLLQQALLNVIVNAEQAMPDGGRIELRASVTSENGVRLAIQDSGPGIPATVLPHVFEPFFTTKPVGDGTGLGLAIAYGIVQDHGGSLTAANSVSGGALLTMTLPAAPPAETETGSSGGTRRRTR
jgi:signal transduction histidine kinase